MALISTDMAAKHLGLEGTEYAFNIETKIAQAEAHVITYLKRPDHTWDENTDPTEDLEFAIVQGAILEVLANLYFDRGDRDNPSDGPITPRIKNALGMLRDPALS